MHISLQQFLQIGIGVKKIKRHIHDPFKRNLLTLTLTASLSFNLNQTTPSFFSLSLSLSSPFPRSARESGHPLHTANFSLSIQTCLSPLSFSLVLIPQTGKKIWPPIAHAVPPLHSLPSPPILPHLLFHSTNARGGAM